MALLCASSIAMQCIATAASTIPMLLSNILRSCLPLLPNCSYMVTESDQVHQFPLASETSFCCYGGKVEASYFGPHPVNCLSITRCILIHLHGRLGGTRGHMAEWCYSRGETKVARNVPTPPHCPSWRPPIMNLGSLSSVLYSINIKIAN